MEMRESKGLELADRGRVVADGAAWIVFSLNGPERYSVTLSPVSCDCPDHQTTHEDCKHISAVKIFASRRGHNLRPVEPYLMPPVEWPRPTYGQDWPAYDRAQQNEKAEFQRLLADLCGTVPQREKNPKGGRNFAPLADVIFATIFKVYAGFSGRRFATDLREAEKQGHVAQSINHTTIARCLEDPEMTAVLTRLIEASALPFCAIEDEFAVDSSGFSACRFDKWFSVKHQRVVSEHPWVKCHVLTGTTTQVVVAVVVSGRDSADSPQFPGLVNTAAKHFKIRQMTGDKAYTGSENFQTAEDLGGTLYAPFKVNTSGTTGGIFQRMYHQFCLNKDEYLAHYHRRSNIESVFSAVKRLFGDSVRSKTDTAMVNEVLGKLLAYNITCLVHAIYELGLDPAFAEEPALPALLKFPGVG
jgi:transposase